MTRPTRDLLRHTAPFAVWIGLQSCLPATAGAYALRSAATAVVALVCLRGAFRWRMPSPARLVAGVLFGTAVAALWILPDGSVLYRTWCCWPIGTPVDAPTASPYDPAVCGWTLTLAKLAGSAFVIAPVEEVFFRSFLYRWLQHHDFTQVRLAHFDASAFLWMVFLFTLEHDRPLVAALAGAAYGFAAIRWGLGAAVVAHVTTNLLLALHVIGSGAWGFW